jgi:hypothetical protein
MAIISDEVMGLMDEWTGQKLLRHSCKLFERAINNCKPIGSGVFVEMGGYFFLLTASHVMEHLTNDNPPIVQVNKNHFVSLHGDILRTDFNAGDGIDIACIRLRDNIVDSLRGEFTFLPVSKIRHHRKTLNGSNYCAFGFHENDMTMTETGLKYFAQAYYLQPSASKVYEFYDIKPDHAFLMEMKGKGIDIKNGIKNKVNTYFYGLSGGGLWLYWIRDLDGEKSIEYRLIGILSEFNRGKHYFLKAENIWFVICAIQNQFNINLTQKRMSYGINN